MTQLKITGLTGPAQSGKNTTAQFISRFFRTECDAFAAPLHALAIALFGFKDHTELEQKKDIVDDIIGFSPRQIMQLVGTEIGRNIDPQLWINGIKKRLQKHEGTNKTFIITDVRFNNEAEYIRQKQGNIWHIGKEDAKPVNKHSSENGVTPQPGDKHIKNNGTLDELEEQIIGALND